MCQLIMKLKVNKFLTKHLYYLLSSHQLLNFSTFDLANLLSIAKLRTIWFAIKFISVGYYYALFVLIEFACFNLLSLLLIFLTNTLLV